MGCGSAKISQSSATHVASTHEGDSEIDWDSHSSQPSSAAAAAAASAAAAITSCSSTSGQCGHHGHSIHRIISSNSQFSTVTAISNSSRIRVTLSSDGSLLQIETENLSVAGSSGEEAATSDDLMDMTELEERRHLSSSDEECEPGRARPPRQTVHSALVTARQGGEGGQSPDRSSSAFSDMLSSTSSQWNSVPTNSPHIEPVDSINNTPVACMFNTHNEVVTVHRQDSCDSTMNGPCETAVCQSILESPSASTVTIRPAMVRAGGSLDRVLENCENSIYSDPITSPCSEDGAITNTRVFSDPSLDSVSSTRKETKSLRSFFGRNTVPRSVSTQSSFTAKSKGSLPTSSSLGSIAKLRQAFASVISSSKDKDDTCGRSPSNTSKPTRSRGKLHHANTIVTLHATNGAPPMLNGNASASSLAKVKKPVQVKGKTCSNSAVTTPSTDPEDQGVSLGEQFSTIYNDISETEANFLALHVHQDFFNDFEDLFDTDAPYLSCHQDDVLDL